MNRHPIFIITVTLSLLLSACVPIPAIPPDTTPASTNPAPAAETKPGFSDLASGLAKIDKADDIQPYTQLLDEIATCIQVYLFIEEESPAFSDSEAAAVTIFFAGMLSMMQLFAQEFEQDLTEDSAASDETGDESSAYEMLEMAFATAC